MVTKWGLSSKLGPMRYGDESDEPFLGMTAGSSRQDISDETARVIDQEVKSILTDCYDQATSILKEHLDKLHVMAKALVDYETIDSNQIDSVVLKKEQELILEELKNSGKTDEIVKKISVGKINKFKEENSLLTQTWVMEPKKKVKDVLAELKVPDLKIKEYFRIKIGE